MRSSMFFPKLAVQNIGKNKRFYFPYLITCVFTIAMFYDLAFVTNNEGLQKIKGGDDLSLMLNFGCWIVGIFSAIFLFYTNSFLVKHRKKEIGLYNILGMSKMNIAHVLVWETLITAAITLLIGIGGGILISKLMLLLLCAIMKFDIQLGFSVSFISLRLTVCIFAAIFLLTLFYNLACIRLSKPVELLKGGNVGEKEPKAKWFMALLGVIALGVAYYIALTTENPISAIPLFFLAVVLVIFGTYTLFISGSIAVLKILRNKKSYYYKPNHFTGVSGMIYRMKQNAAGLASICILSTMVLVMVSGTVCLNIGSADALNSRAPYDVSFTSNMETEPKTDKADFFAAISRVAEQNKLEMTDKVALEYLEVTMVRDENKMSFYDSVKDSAFANDVSKVCIIQAVTDKEYNLLTGNSISLSDDEMQAVFCQKKQEYKTVTLGDKEYDVKWLKEFPISSRYESYPTNVLFAVLSENSFNEYNRAQAESYKDEKSNIEWNVSFNLSGSDTQKVECFNAMVNEIANNTHYNYSSSSKQVMRDGFLNLNGGLFFIGIFLGALFVGFTTLIIYYKQISEGYDDKERFEIMQKVGMSKTEVKRSINSQVLKVFFLPLIMAVVHLCFAFKIICKLLALLGLINTNLFMLCIVGTVVVFALIYFLIYYFTAKTYYKIVNA